VALWASELQKTGANSRAMNSPRRFGHSNSFPQRQPETHAPCGVPMLTCVCT